MATLKGAARFVFGPPEELDSHGLPPITADEIGRQWNGVDSSLLTAEDRPGPRAGGGGHRAGGDHRRPEAPVAVGADAELVLGTRAALDDATFEEAMRQTLDPTW